jgi:hypothetical protein
MWPWVLMIPWASIFFETAAERTHETFVKDFSDHSAAHYHIELIAHHYRAPFSILHSKFSILLYFPNILSANFAGFDGDGIIWIIEMGVVAEAVTANLKPVFPVSAIP